MMEDEIPLKTKKKVKRERMEKEIKRERNRGREDKGEEFVLIFTKFVEDRCYEDEGVRIQSRRLYDKFKEWMREKGINYEIDNRRMSIKIKEELGKYKVKKYSKYNAFEGICLKEDYRVEEIPDYKGYKKDRRKYQEEYYIKNRERLRMKQRENYTTRNAHDKELIKRGNITEEQMFKRKRLGLIKYIMEGEEVNWEETIKKMNEKVDKYVRGYNIDKVNTIDIYGGEKKVVDINCEIEREYEIDTNNLSKEEYIKFKQWYNFKSDEIWSMDKSVEERDKLLKEFYEKYYHVDERFDELYEEDIDYHNILKLTRS